MNWRAWVRRIAVVAYLAAIPACAVIAVLAVVVPAGNSFTYRFPFIASGIFFALLFSWRLWLNLRAGLCAGALTSPWWVMLSLGVLALGGAAIALAGAAYIGFSFWLLFSGVWSEASDPPLTISESLVGLTITSGIGLLAVALGGLLAWPFMRRVRRKPS